MMCGNCSDFVDMCTEGDCYNPKGGAYSKYAKFYLGGTFCAHLTEKYGTTSASLYDHVYYEHDPSDYDAEDVHEGVVVVCSDDCVKEGWYSLEAIERVSRKVFPSHGPERL